MRFAIEDTWFGFDIGRVVTEFLLGRRPDDIGDAYLYVEPYPQAFEAIGAFVEATSPSRTYAVSYCRLQVEMMTRRWLSHHRFYERTGFRPDMLGFTQDLRTNKASEAMRLTGGRATSFMDDKLVMLTPMQGLVPQLILYGPQPNEQTVPQGIEQADDWPTALAMFGLRI
jgi:hypothetical protein